MRGRFVLLRLMLTAFRAMCVTDVYYVAWDAWPGMAEVVAEERATEVTLSPAKL